MAADSRRVKLADLVILNPRLAKPLGSEDLVSFVSMAAVDADTASISTTEVRRYADVSKGYTTFEDGDILVAKITPCFENGKIAQAKIARSSGFGSTEFHVLRPRNGELESRYLLHYLRQGRVRHDGERKMTGSAGQRRVPPHFFENLYLPLPSMVEQRRISAALDQVEELRGKRREALAQLGEFAQSLFLDMFGDSRKNPRGLGVGKLGTVSTRITKGESPAWQGFDYQNNGVLFVTSENVRLGEIDLRSPKYVSVEFHHKLRRSALKKGDILVNLVGASIGRSCVFEGWGGPANVNQAVAVITLDPAKVDVPFIAGLLNSQRGQEMLLGNRVEGARANISLTDLRELDILLPPLDVQHEYGRRVEAVARLKTRQRAHLAELDALFASLQYQAFRGEL